MAEKQSASAGELSPAYLIPLSEVINRVGLKRSTIYNRVKDGSFPAPRKLGEHPSAPVRWNSQDIDIWINSLPTSLAGTK